MAPKYSGGRRFNFSWVHEVNVSYMSASLMLYFTRVHTTLHRKIAVKQRAHYQMSWMSFPCTAAAVCSCKWWHNLRWWKCPFCAFCLTPNDCCKLNRSCFSALMGANRKLRMVIVQITWKLLPLPPFYGTSSALKTGVPLRSTVRLHIKGNVSP